MADQMDIEILEDGTVSVTTGSISNTNHYSAEQFLEELEKELGSVAVKEKRKEKAHVHRKGKTHVHAH